jgi:hypothetical protein
MIDIPHNPTPEQVHDYYMLLRAGENCMPKEARWKTCQHFSISMAELDKFMLRWKKAKDRKNRSKIKSKLVKLTERAPLDRETALVDYHGMSDLTHQERVRKIAAYWGETIGRVYALIGYNPELKKKPHSAPYEPTPEQVALECEQIRNGEHERCKAPKWSKKVTRVRAGLLAEQPVETQVSDFGTLSGRARTKLA